MSSEKQATRNTAPAGIGRTDKVLKDSDKEEREETVSVRADANSVPPRRFKAVMGRRFADFATSQQQDASYFFGHLLDLLESEERSVADRIAGDEQPPCSRLFMWSLEQRVQVRRSICSSSHALADVRTNAL